MALTDEEASAGAEQVGDDLTPAVDVGQPAERADPGVDEVEPASLERLGRRVELGDDELRLHAGSFGEEPRLLDRRLGEVEAGHARAETGERDRVRSDVALEVHAVQPRDVAEPGEVEAHDTAQELRVLGETRDRVVGRRDVRGHALVPVGAVDVDRVAHVAYSRTSES